MVITSDAKIPLKWFTLNDLYIIKLQGKIKSGVPLEGLTELLSFITLRASNVLLLALKNVVSPLIPYRKLSSIPTLTLSSQKLNSEGCAICFSEFLKISGVNASFWSTENLDTLFGNKSWDFKLRTEPAYDVSEYTETSASLSIWHSFATNLDFSGWIPSHLWTKNFGTPIFSAYSNIS